MTGLEIHETLPPSVEIPKRSPGLWQRVKTRLQIMRLSLMAEEVNETIEAPPNRLGWEAVARYFGETLEGYRMRRLGFGPGATIGREELVAALEAMGYPLTTRRVVLTIIYGYGRRD